MNPEEQPTQTPRSIADAVSVVESANTGTAVPGAVQPAPDEPAQSVVKAGAVEKKSKGPLLRQKKFIITAAVLAVLLLGGGLFLAFGSTGDDTDGVAGDTPDGKLGLSITVLDGQATFSSDGETWQDLTRRSPLAEGDYVRTDTGSRLVLTLDDGSAVRLDEATLVRLQDLSADTVVVEQRSGYVYSRVVKSDRTYTVLTNDVSYTALGTAFQTSATGAEKGVKVLESSVKFDDITVAEGKQYYAEHSATEYVEKITDIPVDELKTNSFLLWNLEQDEKDSQFKNNLGYWQKVKNQQQPAETAPAGAQITLQGSPDSKGAALSWAVSGIAAPDGFKIVRSQSSVVPVFGKDESQHTASPSARSYTWSSTKSGVFHYRVCVYKASDSSCTAYSNTVTVETNSKPPEAVVPGAVELAISEGVINWTFSGTAPHKFKVLVSSSPNPVYPKDAEHHGTAPYTLKLRPTGTYYVRVCKYTASDSISGGCTDYSNEVQWNAP